MLVLRNLYTIKILPHSNATESIGKYKKIMSLATSQVMRLKGSRTTRTPEIWIWEGPFEICAKCPVTYSSPTGRIMGIAQDRA